VLGFTVTADRMVRGPEPEARADAKGPLYDSDGDLLPDHLEWVMLTSPGAVDSDNDGRDDFLEAIAYEPPVHQATGPVPEGPLESGVRVVLSAVRLADSRDHVFLNLLFRIAPNDPRQIRTVEPFLQMNGLVIPIAQLVGAYGLGISMRPLGAGGYAAVVTARIAYLDELRHLLPCTVGARVVFGDTEFKTGTVVELVGSMPAAVAPVSSSVFAFQSLASPQDQLESTWRPNQVCLFQLAQIGASPESIVFEIIDASCQPAVILCCDSVGCEQKEGGIVRMPNGLRGLRGG
jgi:hypothetical protein